MNMQKNAFMSIKQFLLATSLGVASSVASAQDAEVETTRWSLEGIASSAARNSAVPPLSQNLESQRMILLTLSVDHQLFMAAYNDYDDIYKPEGEAFAVPETTYTHEFTYAGYFDSGLCYQYTANADEGHYKASGVADSDRYCTAGGWSGNFLNWATMTRMDLVRFVLYGGYRRLDTSPSGSVAAQTILERAYLPQDAHSFAKYYDGADIDKLTDGLPSACDAAGSGGASCAGYTFCNTTRPSANPTPNAYSQDPEIMNWPPVLRAVKGNYSLWASNERYQCLTSNEVPLEGTGEDFNAGQGQNANNPAVTGIPAFPESPANSRVNDFVVRVEVCSSAAGDVRESFCHQYQANSYKPRGLLQEQGGAGEVHFGLITGSYNSNKSFGALRKRVSSFADEVNPDGTFVHPSLHAMISEEGDAEQSEEEGADEAALTNSIVANLNALRIIDYKFRAGDDDSDYGNWQGVYRDAYHPPGQRYQDGESHDPTRWRGRCDWGLTGFVNGECRNWGNPFSELLAESYVYFSGQEKQARGEDDSNILPGLTVDDWPEPTEEFMCANLNVVGFNSSSVSYDDGTEYLSDIGDAPNLSQATTAELFGGESVSLNDLVNRIGMTELDPAKQYFVGRVGDVNVDDGQCTAKSIDNLADVSGTCPEAPNSLGTYWGAGLAYFAHTKGVAPLGEPKRSVSTYGVTLAGALPKISVPVPPNFVHGDTVEIIPACRNLGQYTNEEQTEHSGPKGNCSLVDFKPLKVFSPEEEGVYSGKYYVGWEDSEQGGDFDLDLSGTISFNISPSGLVIDTQIISVSASDEIEFGFIVSGTDRDGAHFPSKVVSGAIDERLEKVGAGSGCGSVHCSTIGEGAMQHQRITFGLGGSVGDVLEAPLYYAAKWGAFDYENENDVPSDESWDGSSYLEVTDPSRLKANLKEVIDNIIDKPVAGTGASVATTALTGEGIILSTLFLPKAGEGANEVDWVGRLNGLFRADDETWEDSAEPFGVRTDADNVVRFSVVDNKTVFHRYSVTRDVETGAIALALVGAGNALPYSELKSVWNARDMLAGVNNFEQNRPYTAQAANRRYIFTAIAEESGQLTNEEVVPFVADHFDGGESAFGLGADNYRLLDVGNAENAENVVNFVRGVEGIEGFRNRSVTVGAPNSDDSEGSEGDDVEGNEGEEDAAEDEQSPAETTPWLLGDIAHSTPALVGRPSAIYDSRRLNDLTYSQFRAQYANRRLVTYVGANDGMLHAFNSGFVQPYRSNLEADADIVNSLSYGLTPPDGTAVTEHALGSELWSYVPYNLLPHLKWLTDPNYQHVYYVDSSVNEFDVNIFPASATHPEGWGTIIVVGMRFGGAPVSLDVGEEANRQFRSAYIVFDVTNPEAPPRLLGEITHPDLGYTLGDIDVVSFRKPKANGTYAAPLDTNKWYLTFGSGPQEISDASSNQNASLFFLDLNKLAGGDVDLQKHELTGASKSYVGGITAVDWDDDFNDDMLYFGTVGTGTGAADSKGALMQATLAYGENLSVTASKLLDADLPFSREPLAVKESTHGGMWVYASTGKFLTQAHLDDIDANGMFGVRVNRAESDATQPRWTTTTTYAEDELVNMADYNVRTEPVLNDDNEVVSRIFTITRMGETVVRDELEQLVRNNHGWRRSFSVGELSDTRPFYAGSTLGISSFLPGVSSCSPDAKSRLYILNLFNGLPQMDAASFVLANSGSDGGVLTDAGDPDSGDVGLYTESDTKSNDASLGPIPVVPGSDGSFKPGLPGQMPGIPGRRSWREVPMDELGL